jgi:hypothetical protein
MKPTASPTATACRSTQRSNRAARTRSRRANSSTDRVPAGREWLAEASEFQSNVEKRRLVGLGAQQARSATRPKGRSRRRVATECGWFFEFNKSCRPAPSAVAHDQSQGQDPSRQRRAVRTTAGSPIFRRVAYSFMSRATRCPMILFWCFPATIWQRNAITGSCGGLAMKLARDLSVSSAG